MSAPASGTTSAASVKAEAPSTGADGDPPSAGTDPATAASASQATPAVSASQASPAASASQATPAATASQATPAASASQATPAASASQATPVASASQAATAASASQATPVLSASKVTPAANASQAATAASQASVHSGGSGSGSGSQRSSGSSSSAGGKGASSGAGVKVTVEGQKPRVSIKTPSMEATKAAAEAAAAAAQEEDEDDPYALAEERHRELRKRLLYLTQPRASILSERSDPRAGACEQRSLISQYLRQRDPRLFISSQRRAVRSFLPPLFRAQFTATATPQRTTGSRRRLPEQTLENQRLMEREYSSKKHRMQAEQLLESRIVQERCQLPMLGRAGAHCHRSELRHNFCIDVLERGCHQAHAEMYRLLRRDVELKSAQQPPAALLQDTLPKLQRLKQCLVDMEEATRRHDYMSAYGAANDLAFFFLKERADLWLASHFFEKCLEFGKKIEDDGKMRESEAHCNVGIMEFFDDNIDSALSHLERFRRLSYKQVWETADGYSYYRYSCLLLQDVYLSQAVAAENDDLETAFKLYLRASVMANQAANMQAEAMAQYNLGEIQEKMGNWQNALRRYEAYLRLSDKLLNFTGVCTGCFKIAKCHEAMGKLPLAVDNLKRSEHIARGQHLDDEIVRASSELGHIYLSMGKNDLAFRQFMEAYHYVELSESVANDHSYVASAMVGISSASRLLPEFAETVYRCRPEELARLLQWKTARLGMHVEEPPGPKWY